MLINAYVHSDAQMPLPSRASDHNQLHYVGRFSVHVLSTNQYIEHCIASLLESIGMFVYRMAQIIN